jgi:hypothetical protein
MRLITDHLLTAVAIVAIIVLFFFYRLAAGYAVDPSFVSVTAVSAANSPLPAKDKAPDDKLLRAFSAWIGGHSWGWGHGRPKQGFGADEIALDAAYPNGSHVKVTIQKDTICVTGQDGVVWRLLTPPERRELGAMLAD